MVTQQVVMTVRATQLNPPLGPWTMLLLLLLVVVDTLVVLV
jgi:hypothetical protein